jgi:hypothetical protein
MPAKQRGSTLRRGKTWSARWADENGAARFKGGFQTKTEAREWLDATLGRVEALRHGDPVAIARQEIPTLSSLKDEYLAQHICEENTKTTLEARLNYATGSLET